MALKKILEQCQVSAPPGSVPSTTIPLTFFDLPWLYCSPIQRLFFFDFPHPTHHFLHTLLPSLKHSLSLSLQHFFPFAATLVLPPHPLHHHPYFLYHDGDSSLPFIIAESSDDFSRLVSDSPTDVTELHHLVPALPPPRSSENGTRLMDTLMAIQVTILPNSGLAMGFTFNHVVGDGRSFHHFIKFWASISRTRGNHVGSLLGSDLPLPIHTRDIIQDPKGLKLVYLKELKKTESKSMEFAFFVNDVSSGNDKVRATFVLNRDQIEKLKKWASLRFLDHSTGTPHLSTFVLTCSLMWVCMIKSLEEDHSQDDDGKVVARNNNSLLDEQIMNFFLVADCRNHPELFTIPSTYFGNCLDMTFVSLERGRLAAENGFVEAVSAVERKVRERKIDPLRGAETAMSDLREKSKSGQHVLSIAGSPRLGVYETDFGWGKPRKSEVVHIELNGSISLSDGRDNEVAIEIGVALRRTQMNIFADILEEELRRINNT